MTQTLYAHKKKQIIIIISLNWVPVLTPITLATQEAEIRRIIVQSQPRQIVPETLSQKKPITKKCWWTGSRCRP
jgi:hypothetical protein